MRPIAKNVLLAGGMIALVLSVINLFHQPSTPTHTVDVNARSAHWAFLEQCSGLKNEETVALAYCMGRIRGLADGHQLTTRIVKTDNPSGKNVELWCIDEKTTDGQLYDAVITWVVNNPTRYQKISEPYTDDQSKSMAAIIAGLHDSFPCDTQDLKTEFK